MKAIPGFPRHFVASDGRVFSFCPFGHSGPPLESPREVAQVTNRKGYKLVNLGYEGRKQTFQVHRLVLEAYDGPSQNRQCRHLNGDSSDNRIENLAWGTAIENAQDRINHGHQAHMKGEQHGRSKLTRKDIMDIRKLATTGVTQKAIALKYGVHQCAISRIIHRKRWRHI